MKRSHKVLLSLLFMVDLLVIGAVFGPRFWQKTIDDPVAIFTAVLTAFTGFLAWSTYFLWRATRDLVEGAERAASKQRADTIKALAISKESADTAAGSLEHARNAFVIENRAYITPDRFGTRKAGDSTQVYFWRFAPRWVNTGRTPAVKIRLRTNYTFIKEVGDIPDYFSYKDAASAEKSGYKPSYWQWIPHGWAGSQTRRHRAGRQATKWGTFFLLFMD